MGTTNVGIEIELKLKKSRVIYLESRKWFFYIQMLSKKEILNFCNASLFFNYDENNLIDQLNQLLLCIYNE